MEEGKHENNLNNIILCKSPPSSFISSIFGSICINNDRNLVSFGKNEKGFLGQVELGILIPSPKKISNLYNIKTLDCGYSFTVCVNFDGEMFTFGNNSKGQLGIDKDKNVIPHTNVPQRIMDIPPIDFISCGRFFTVAITNEGNAFSFGNNYFGQLGIGNNESYKSPLLITDLTDIEIVRCGGYYTICKTYSDEYYSWGDNDYGQLGQGTINSCNKPIKCENWPEDIIDIKCGDNHTLLLTSTGFVYSFGANKYRGNNGTLGLNERKIYRVNIPTLIKDIPLIKRIECGEFHSMCIDINDKLWVFGTNNNGQLGLGDKVDKYKPILNESLHDIIDISSGRGYHTFVKTINNEIHAFGSNKFGQFGIETSTEYQLTPIKICDDINKLWVSNSFKSKQKSARN